MLQRANSARRSRPRSCGALGCGDPHACEIVCVTHLAKESRKIQVVKVSRAPRVWRWVVDSNVVPTVDRNATAIKNYAQQTGNAVEP
jgi:hypothetical protein